ncbi:hypothetical protein [Methylocystis sp. ATCC 49242]|nr:hypothetical protein [Methylocystis sp. ATCC 49242]
MSDEPEISVAIVAREITREVTIAETAFPVASLVMQKAAHH